MKKYLISLDKDQHRRELFFAQADTADFQLFSAFNTMNENEESLTKKFNLDRFQQRYARKITKGEVGCTLSHLGVYQRIVDDQEIAEDEYCLVCEDDALFVADFQANLDKILAEGLTADIVLVGQSKIPEFNCAGLELNYPITFNCLLKEIKGSPFKVAYTYRNYFAGTVAYLIKKSVARAFLNQAEQNGLPYWLADDFILFHQQFKLDIVVVRPLMVIENPNLNSNLENFRGSISHHVCHKVLKYPAKKLLAIVQNLRK